MPVLNLNLYNSASLVIDEVLVLVFWAKARIPTQNHSNCISKLKALYENLRNIEKSKKKRNTEIQRQKEKEF